MADETTKRHAPLAESRRTYGSKKKTSLELLKISFEKDVRSIVLEDILPNLCTQHGVLPSSVIASCNAICSLSRRIQEEALDILESVFRCFLPCLLHNVREVRTSALRAIRYLIRSGSHFDIFVRLHLDYLVARSLDLSTDGLRNSGLYHLEQCENVQALRLVSHLVHIDPLRIPPSLVRPLVALVKEAIVVSLTPPNTSANSDDSSTEHTARACLLILTEITLLNPNLVYECGGLTVLLDAILSSMLSSSMRIPEAILLAVLHTVNSPETRKLLPDCQFIEHLISPLTSPSTYQLNRKVRKGSQETHLSEMKLASSALLLSLRSWPGLMYLCQPNSTAIRSLTDLLVVGTEELQRHLLDLFYDVFHVQKLATDSMSSFEYALESLDSQTWKSGWSLTEGFVAEEGLELLTYKSVSKMNLIDNHLALLILVFVSSGLIEGLCRLLVQSNTEELSVMAGILLAELMHLLSVLLAPDHPVSQSASRTLSLLLDNDRSRRVLHWLERVHRLKEQTPQPYSPFLASLLSSTSSVPPQLSHGPSNSIGSHSSHSSKASNAQSTVSGSVQHHPHGGRIATLLNSSSNLISSGWLPTEAEERPRHGSLSYTHIKMVEGLLDRTISDSNVLPLPHHRNSSSVPSSPAPSLGLSNGDLASPDTWHWDHLLCTVHRLLESVSSPPHAPNSPVSSHPYIPRLVSWEEPSRLRFLRRLVAFFSLPTTPQTSLINQQLLHRSSSTPGVGYFVHRPQSWMWARKATTVVTELFAYLALYPSESEPGSLLAEFLSQFASAVRLICPSASEDGGESFSHNSVLSPGTLERTCSHFLFLPVCQLTWSERGEYLLESSGVTEALIQLITFTRSPLLIKLVVSSLNYSRQGSFSRLLLDRSTTASCEEGRVYVARFLRVLLRADLQHFSQWGIELIHKQVHDAHLPVSREALATLQEACEDDANMVVLARLKPALLHQKFEGHVVACRLLGSLQEFRRLKLKNWIKPELEEWTGDGCYVLPFVEHIEENLFDAMTSYSLPTQLGDDLDRVSSSSRKEAGRYVLAPMHPFGSLARHKEGMEFLRESGCLEGALQTIRDGLRISRGADPKHLRQLKSSLWSLSQIACTVCGVDWVVETDLIQRVMVLVANAGVLSVRGHAFWCLGLIGSTPRGAEILRHKGWSALRSDRLDKWPLQLPQFYGPQESTRQDSGASLASRRRTNTRTESLTSSCDSRRSTGGEVGDCLSWLGNGTTTVRSLGRDLGAMTVTRAPVTNSVGSSSDIQGYATLGRLRDRPALFATGSVHSLGVASSNTVVRMQHHVGGSLSSLAVSGADPASLQPMGEETRRAMRKISSLINPHEFPTEYRGIALPLSCHLLSRNIHAPTSSFHDASTLYDEDVVHTEFEAITEAHGSVFFDDNPSPYHHLPDGEMDGGNGNPAIIRSSNNSLSSASTSDYFSRTRSGSLGPLTQFVEMGTASKVEESHVSEEMESVDKDCVEPKMASTPVAGGPNPLTGLEFHSKDACIICCSGREPSAEFSSSMAQARMEVMECVEKLMSHIHPRKHEVSLLALKEKFPDLTHDFCLFSEVALILARYRFNRAARTFLQEVFLELETGSLYKMAQTVLPPLPEENDES